VLRYVLTEKVLSVTLQVNPLPLMANVLSFDKQVSVIGALAEGSSTRSIERLTGIHHDTVVRLCVRIGEACARMMDEKMRELPCTHIEIDEIWGYVGKKQRSVKPTDNAEEVGDMWTFVALDKETKLVPSFVVGKRDFTHTSLFVNDLASRMKDRIQLSSDGMNQYLSTVDEAFGNEVDYGQIVKVYGGVETEGQRRYSPPPITGINRKVISGNPVEESISTSHVERQNLTLRMHCRRLARLTNAFSKKKENLRAAVGMHFAYYNFVKIHSSIRMTPAMAAGVSSSLWKVADLVALSQ